MTRHEPSTVPTAPRFCPDCGGDAKGSAPLCASCGASTQPRGYCPICERYLRQPVGAFCVKHEVALDEAPAIPAFDGSSQLVTVGVFESATQCEPARIRLEAEGIPTFVQGARMAGRSMYDVAVGGMKLQVPESLAAEARAILSQTWAPLDDDGLDDAWDDLAPEPDEAWLRVLMGVAMVVILGPLMVYFVLSLMQS